MAKKKVCCSFDYEHDRHYYNLLEAWNENDNIEFSIEDCTPNEIQSESVAIIKQVLSTKIGQADYMIAIIGKHSDDKHPNSDEIGYKNWQNFEIAKSKQNGNKLIAIKINNTYESPEELLGSGAS